MPNCKNYKFICFVFLFNLFSVFLYSQESTIYLNDYLNPFVTNPACSGADKNFKALMSVQKRWVGIPNSPSTILLGTNFRIGKYDFYNPKGLVYKGPFKIRGRIGLGAALFQENYGPLANSGGLLSYGYHLPINNKSNLSLGLSLLLFNQSLNTSELNPEKTDSYLLENSYASFKSKIGVGAYYYTYKYFVGVSMIKFLSGSSNLLVQPNEATSFFLTGGYKHGINSKVFTLEPSVGLKKMGNESLIFDAHAKLYVKRLNWIALSYSTSNSMNVQFGLRIYRELYFGYDFGYALGQIATFNNGTHKISLGINLGLNRIDDFK